MKLIITYTFLSIVATIVNIAAQDVAFRVYDGAYPIYFSILVGTATGLIVKYYLDKRYIFHFHAKNALHDSFTFFMYTTMGIFTTLIFWGFELGFYSVFKTTDMRYIGGIAGLSIGYILKYRLDKKYVFGNPSP